MINTNKCFLITFGVLAVIILVMLFNKKGMDYFTVNANGQVPKVVGGNCKIDEDCPAGEFCYMGKCWGYWNGVAMPWSTCRNPYCGCSEPGCNCGASDKPGDGTCLPYCKCRLNRRPGGTIAKNCFPACGNTCLSNDDCPPGCPACRHGICSAPEACDPIF